MTLGRRQANLGRVMRDLDVAQRRPVLLVGVDQVLQAVDRGAPRLDPGEFHRREGGDEKRGAIYCTRGVSMAFGS